MVTREKQPKRGGVYDEQQHVKASPELRGCRESWPCQTHTNPNAQKSRSWLSKGTSTHHQPLGLYNPNQGSRSCYLQRPHEHTHNNKRRSLSRDFLDTFLKATSGPVRPLLREATGPQVLLQSSKNSRAGVNCANERAV